MQETNKKDSARTPEDERIDALIDRIDAFMAKGGGRMNVKGGEGAPRETHCTSCCGEFSDKCVNAPGK